MARRAKLEAELRSPHATAPPKGLMEGKESLASKFDLMLDLFDNEDERQERKLAKGAPTTHNQKASSKTLATPTTTGSMVRW